MAQMIPLDVVESMRDATVNVELKRAREMRLRTWFATRLIRLAAWLLNCNIEFKDG